MRILNRGQSSLKKAIILCMEWEYLRFFLPIIFIIEFETRGTHETLRLMIFWTVKEEEKNIKRVIIH